MEQLANSKEFTDLLHCSSTVNVYFYTPLCGTCGLARKFITMAEKAIAHEDDVYEMDVNLMKHYMPVYAIESVPCLIQFEYGEPVRRIQAFESVTKVYDFLLNSYARSEEK